MALTLADASRVLELYYYPSLAEQIRFYVDDRDILSLSDRELVELWAAGGIQPRPFRFG